MAGIQIARNGWNKKHADIALAKLFLLALLTNASLPIGCWPFHGSGRLSCLCLYLCLGRAWFRLVFFHPFLGTFVTFAGKVAPLHRNFVGFTLRKHLIQSSKPNLILSGVASSNEKRNDVPYNDSARGPLSWKLCLTFKPMMIIPTNMYNLVAPVGVHTSHP